MKTEVRDIWRGISLVVVSGDGVTRRRNDPDDPVSRRILSNGSLFRTIQGDDICFVRKEEVESSLERLAKRRIHVLEVYVTDVVDEDKITGIISFVKAEKIRVGNIVRDDRLREFVAGRLFDDLRLPFLATILILLLANWLVFSSLSGKLAGARAVHNLSVRNEKAASETTERQRLLMSRLNEHVSRDLALRCDKVGASVPEDVRLTSMSAEVVKDINELHVKGEGSSARSVVTFSDALKGCGVFSDVDFVLLDQDRRTGAFVFELKLVSGR